MSLDRKLLVLCIVKEADNALTFRTILNRSNLQLKELEETMGALALDGKIRTFAGDEEKPLSERRFFSAQEARKEIEEYVDEQLPELAGEGRLYFAYGVEIEPDLYKGLSPSGHFLMKGCLEGYRLVFDRRHGATGGMANLRKSTGSEVWGAVYYLRNGSNHFLRLEGNRGDGEVTIRVPVKGAVGPVCVETTLLKTESPLYPTRDYLHRMIRGGEFFGLPQRYLRLVAAIPTLD